MSNLLTTKATSKGILIKFRNKNYKLSYPEKIWQNYLNKKNLINNYAPLATLSLPLMLNLKKIHYNVPEPAFQQHYKELFLKDLPSSTYDNKQNAVKLMKKFRKIKYIFEKSEKSQLINNNTKKSNKASKASKPSKENTKHKAIIPLSLGKDSLLTLGVAREIGLEPISIYINDTVSRKENKQKIELGKKLAKELNQKHYIIENKIERLNDFDTWDKPETNFNYTHMTTGFCFIALPFVQYFDLKYIILGNEQDMNFSFKTSQGLEAWPAYDQTSIWQEEQNKIIKKLSHNIEVTSIIRPLTNIAIIKILYKRYPQLAKYEFSCDCLDASQRQRWCHDCNKCARLFLFMKGFGINTKKISLKNLFQKKHKKLYSLFKGKEVDRYEKSIEAREEQLLAFLLALRHKAKGYLIDYFKKHYLKEAQEREKELRKKYFKLWHSNMPKELKSNVLSIYKEELKDLK